MPEALKSKLENRYQFHSVVGRGGNGEVCAAWDDHLKRTVAIKRIKTAGMDDTVLETLWQEAMRLAAIRHSNIVTVYDMGIDENVPYIVMEYVQGETVDVRVEKGIFSVDEFGELARQTLDGLIAAHHSGLIHRDLKPANIMLSVLPSGGFQVKILDFGMAKFVNVPSAQTMNIDGTITGSIYWISPEQLNRKAVDARSDLYSMGCVFYYALSGHEPFQGEGATDVLTAHLSHRVVSLDEYRPDLPPILCQWVMALINLEPEHRYQSAMQALAALNGILVPPHSFPISVGNSTTTIITPAVAAPGIDEPVQPAKPESPTPQSQPMEVKPTPVPSRSWTTTRLVAGAILILALAGAWLIGHEQNGRFGSPFYTAATVSSPVPSPAQETAHASAPKPAESVNPASTNGTTALVVANRIEAVKTPISIEPVATMKSSALISTPAPIAATVPVATSSASPVPTASPAPVAIPAEITFRVHGSNTIGAKLLPALMEGFLKSQGASNIRRNSGQSAEEMAIEAQFPGDKAPKAVEIAAHGSKTAFDDLLSGRCDLGMASRPVKAEEAAAIAGANLGDLNAPSCGHVLGLDGIAIVVNRDNTVSGLTKQEIAKIFTGEITDWSQVGGQAGPIHLYARDAKSGTFDTFKSLVLEKAELSANAKRFEDSNELSDAVSSDPSGVGFVGLPFVRSSKALAVSDVGTMPLIATRFTVATEDYLLSRRLFLYTTANPRSALTRKFVEFALSDEGQEIVQKMGFVKQTPDLQRFTPPAGAPQQYCEIAKDSERVSLNLRFRAASSQLDNKALRDLDRITNMLGEERNHGRELLLLGFADSVGSEAVNLRLSKERAQIIAQEFATRGITATTVTGFGSALPIASNDTEAGRDKNRRVEVWLK